MATGPEDGRSAPRPVPDALHRGTPISNAAIGAVSPPSKRELASWWRKFSRKPEKDDEKVSQSPGIFGVPLAESIRYANVAISLTNEQGESFIYGYVPIVVAKCGVFLKEKATDVEGIFRLSGSAKRIKDLQALFDSPDRYGKGLDWTGYTVHDAANILRRYLNQLPEPIVPLDCYERFRDPLRSYQARMNNPHEGHSPEFTASEHAIAVVAYQKLITELPALNRQLLLYILDLLAVFASKSDLNRMTAANLAAIFQPGIISHPDHDMAPQEYRLSQDVLIYLIENQDNFLIGMAGTSVDEQTQKEVESGAPSIKSPKPNLGRTASNGSAGADSLRKFGGVRRNASTSSRTSRADRTSPNVSSPGTPSTPSYGAGTNTGSLGRSNTVPSKRSPAIASHRFQRAADSSIQTSPVSTPTAETEVGPLPQSERKSTVSQVTNIPREENQAFPAVPITMRDVPTAVNPSIPTKPPGEPGPAIVPVPVSIEQQPRSRERKISNLFSRSPIFGPSPIQLNQQERQPRKLQKRQRLPGSLNESAQSSQASLQNEDGFHTPLVSPGIASVNQSDPMSSINSTTLQANTAATPEHVPEHNLRTTPSTQGQNSFQGLRPPRSPSTSLHSRGSMTDASDLDGLDDPAAKQEYRRNRWRLSSTARRTEDAPLAPPPPIGQNPGARTSNSSIGSTNRPRQSFTHDSQISHQAATDSSSTGQPSLVAPSSQESSEPFTKEAKAAEEEKKSLFGKWKAKMQQSREERKEKEAEKERAKSPQRFTGDNASSRHSLSAFAQEHLAPRGKSFDKGREEALPVVNEQVRVEKQTPQNTLSASAPLEPNQAQNSHGHLVSQQTVQQSNTSNSVDVVQQTMDQSQLAEGQGTQNPIYDTKAAQPPVMEMISEERPVTAEQQPISERKND